MEHTACSPWGGPGSRTVSCPPHTDSSSDQREQIPRVSRRGKPFLLHSHALFLERSGIHSAHPVSSPGKSVSKRIAESRFVRASESLSTQWGTSPQILPAFWDCGSGK